MGVRRVLVGGALAALVAAAGTAAAAPHPDAFGRTLPGQQRLVVSFADHPTARQAVARLRGLGRVRPLVPEIGVWSVQPRRPVTARDRALGRIEVQAAEWSLERSSDEQTPKADAPPAVNPTYTDPLFSPADQWSLFTNYWDPSLTGTLPRPRIAILDGGIDSRHEEWSGPNSPLVYPRSTYQEVNSAEDWGRTGHGTHVAGIAAAPANNGVGIVGVAPAEAGSAEVIPVQIADRDGRSTDATMMAGIRWAVNHQAKVINISAGGPGYSQAFQDTVDWAFQRGALIVASVGNEGEDENEINYPAGYQHVLGVGAQCDTQPDPPDCPIPLGAAGFSNHNGTVDLIAPGVNVLSSVPRRVVDREFAPGYALKDGTSMAAPYVTGSAALVFAAHPGISAYQVLRQLENTAVPIGIPGRDDASGYGAVNPKAAVTLPPPADDPDEINDDVPKISGMASLKESDSRLIEARADRYDDPRDVYPVQLRAGQTIRLRLDHDRGEMVLGLWRPGTRTVSSKPRNVVTNRIAAGVQPGERQTAQVRVPATGRYYVSVVARRGGGAYRLTVSHPE
jgi:subtilisin family serine protease